MEARFDRRHVLAGLGALSGMTLFHSRAHAAVRFLATPRLDGAARSLILFQLSGGNDGIETIVPYREDAYYRARATLTRKKEDLLALDDYRGFHPALKNLRTCWDAGQLAIVEGVGYPNPNRSHFESLDIWHTADPRGRAAGLGWIGKLCEAAWPAEKNPNLVVHIGPSVPYSLHSVQHRPASFVDPEGYRWIGEKGGEAAYRKAGEGEAMMAERASSLELLRRVLAASQVSSDEIRRAVAAYQTSITYPDEPLSQSLRHVAALVAGGTGSRVISVELGGFDTHADQRERHDELMTILDGALGPFLADLGRSEAGKAAVVLVFSEFGRRVAENGAIGTDHGVAGPMFALGHQIKGGLFGKHPSFETLVDGDLVHTTDFRSVYAGVIEGCFRVPHEKVLGAKYPLVQLV
jgi:uncharacterized protein (DUF1501 family)